MFKVTEKVTGITRVSRVHFSVLNKTLIYHARNEAEEMKVQMAHAEKKIRRKSMTFHCIRLTRVSFT